MPDSLYGSTLICAHHRVTQRMSFLFSISTKTTYIEIVYLPSAVLLPLVEYPTPPRADHVKTQIPYAFLAAVVGVIVGDLPTGYGAYPDWVGLLLGIVVTVCVTIAVTVPIDGDKLDPISRGCGWLKSKIHMPVSKTKVADASDAEEAKSSAETGTQGATAP